MKQSTPIWYAFYDLRSGNAVGAILTTPEPTWGAENTDITELQLCVNDTNFAVIGTFYPLCPALLLLSREHTQD